MAVGAGVGVGPLQATSKLIAIASRRSFLAIRAHLRTTQFKVTLFKEGGLQTGARSPPLSVEA
jgi:hypothetical protein